MASKDPYRGCDLCGGVDQHPRHTFAGVIEGVWEPSQDLVATVEKNLTSLADDGKITVADAIRIGREFWDTTSTDRHIDCCALEGCPKSGTPDGCDRRIEVWNGKTGAGMVAAAAKVREDNPEHFETQDEVA